MNVGHGEIPSPAAHGTRTKPLRGNGSPNTMWRLIQDVETAALFP